MDDRRFDALARAFSAAPTRRMVLRAAFASIAAGLGWQFRSAAADCPPNETRCANGTGECCPFFGGTCCGADGTICCGPDDTCYRPGGGAPSICQRKCGANENRCANGAGDCCPFFGGVCCGDGERTCCNPNDICDTQTASLPTCATPCDLFSRRCATTGACCPYGQTCCGTDCCFPGTLCSQGVCVTFKKRRKRKRRRKRHH